MPVLFVLISQLYQEWCCYCLEQNLLFLSLGKGSLNKRILVLFQKCFTCITEWNDCHFWNFQYLFSIGHLLQYVFDVFHFLPAELSSPMPLESDMKKQEHLWQNQSPNFLAEKAFNAAVAALPPHCAVCSLFCPYTKVQQRNVAGANMCQWSSIAMGLFHWHFLLRRVTQCHAHLHFHYHLYCAERCSR